MIFLYQAYTQQPTEQPDVFENVLCNVFETGKTKKKLHFKPINIITDELLDIDNSDSTGGTDSTDSDTI